MQVTDPVCGMIIDSKKAASTNKWHDDTYYFCSTSCQEKFRASPERYAGNASAAKHEHEHGHGCCHGSGHGEHRQGGGWFRRLFGGSRGH